MWAKCGLNIYICSMATIKFIIQSKKSPAGIYVRLREGRNIDAKAKTNFAINPQDWSNIKGQPKNLKEANFKQLNEDLIKLSADLLSHYNQSNGTQEINSDWLKDFINPKIEESTARIPCKLVDYVQYYTKHKKNAIGSSTYKRNMVYKNLILKFEVSEKTAFLIKDINADFKLKFEEFCKSQNYALNTIARTIKFIKTICLDARKNQIETHYQLDNIKVKFVPVDKIYLTKEELQLIESAKLEHDYLDNARDWLLISCETGQRVSDFMRFNKDQIRYEGNVPLIEFTQIKTGKIMAIPLSKKVRTILEKRNGDFPRKISDQKYNVYIKEVCKKAEIDELIKGSKQDAKTQRKESGLFPKYELVTSHIGRRSFATNNYGRIPTPLLINVTGHTTEGMFLEYIGKTQTDKAIHLAEYFV
jgi:integrase